MNILCTKNFIYIVWLPLVFVPIAPISSLLKHDFSTALLVFVIQILGFKVWQSTLECVREKFCNRYSQDFSLSTLAYFILIAHTIMVFLGLFSPDGHDGFGGFFWMPFLLLDSFANPFFFACTTAGCPDTVSGFISYGIIGTSIWLLMGICKKVKMRWF